MAKLTLSLLLLSFLIASSESLTPSDLPTGNVAGRRDLPGSEADSAATILLPSEKPRAVAAAIDTETAATGGDSNTQDASVFAVAGADALGVAGADPLVVAGADPFVFAGADPLVVAGADPFVFAGADPLVVAGADPFVFAGADPLVVAGADPFVFAGADPLVVAGAEPLVVAGADASVVAVADAHPVVEPEKIVSVPLRTITFRPHDHGEQAAVPLSLRFPFRHGGGRGCRHGRRQFRPKFEGREISFGNDMILSGEKPGHDAESRGMEIERQMPGRWIRVHHRKPRFGFADVAWKEVEDVMKRPDRRHEEREEDEEEREHHHHRRWKEDKDMMMKRPHRPEEREEDDEMREHPHRRWDMMKKPHRPEEHEDDDEEKEHHHHHRHHHHHFRHHHGHEDEEERDGGEGIFKRIRKFLDHHF